MKFFRKCAYALCSLIPNKYIRRAARYAVKYNCIEQLRKNYNSMQNHKNYNDFKYTLAVVATMKNEGEYVCEWLEYYLLMGVEHFYLYNNNGTDDTEEKLAPYIEAGIVTYIVYPGISKQVEIYNHAVENYKFEAKWMLIVDLDEFVLVKDKSYKELLLENEAYNQLVFYWYIFGNSGHIKKPEGLVIENYLNHSDFKAERKSFIKPLHTLIVDKVHEISCIEKTKHLDIDEVQCNHYFGKSEEEYRTKKGLRLDNFGVEKYGMEIYNSHNKNDIYDDKMLQYVDTIKERIKERVSKK